MNKESRFLTLSTAQGCSGAMLLHQRRFHYDSCRKQQDQTHLEHPRNAEGEYPLPDSITSKPVTSSKPTSSDALTALGSAMKILGEPVSEYPVPKSVMLISVISPLKMVCNCSCTSTTDGHTKWVLSIVNNIDRRCISITTTTSQHLNVGHRPRCNSDIKHLCTNRVNNCNSRYRCISPTSVCN